MIIPYVHTTERETAVTQVISQWFDDHHDAMFRYLTRIVGQPEQAADLVQETFLRAMKVLDPALLPAIPQAWLFRIASNLALDHLRRQRRWSWFMRSWQPETNNFDQHIETTQTIRGCLAKLKPQDAEVLLMVHYAGCSPAEVAKLNGEELGAVRKRLSRARDRFRNLYEEERGHEVS